jgi:hypothetical protein
MTPSVSLPRTEMFAKLLTDSIWSALFAAQHLSPTVNTEELQQELTVLFAAVTNLRRRVESEG